jgi:hypothetical protein
MVAPALAAVLVAVAVLLPAAGAAGPIHAPATIDEYFRLEWQATPGARGPEIAGYVANVGNVPVDRMQILVERLDAAGAVVGSSRAWVMGVVAPLHRTYFTTRVAPATAYRVSILTFDWTNCRD